jgi:hypothetical protein
MVACCSNVEGSPMKKALAFALLITMTATVSLAHNEPATVPGLAELQQMTERFAPTPYRADLVSLSAGDRQALAKLIEAAEVIDNVFLRQYWSGNLETWSKLQNDTTPIGRARAKYFWINKGPWSQLDAQRAFLPGVPARKLPGSHFYPDDMTRQEFERWAATLSPERKQEATGFFWVIRRDGRGKLTTVPYSQEYREDLAKAAALLKDAASLTDNASLKRFLDLRADAFLSNNYYESDVAWMDLDSPLDVTIGPYETYADDLFNYKAAFEAYVNVRDEKETAKLSEFSRHLQEIESNLPEDPKYRNPKLGAQSPIRVVNEVVGGGEGNQAVQTAAYNLPNDERVVREKGSKRVMLKNVQAAKFRQVLVPIAERTLSKKEQPDVSFEMFFTHILAHELMHGLGPHQITLAGRQTNPRQELKELYGPLEEAKADVTGLFALQYMMDHAKEMKLGDLLPADEAAERQLYITYLASSFRTLRFGTTEAHGKGMAMQFNYFLDKGAFVAQPDGSFALNIPKMKTAVRDLTHELLTLEATGDYAGAKQMLTRLVVVRPEVKRALANLEGIPTDIEPQFLTASEVMGSEVVLNDVPRKPATRVVAKKKKTTRKKPVVASAE